MSDVHEPDALAPEELASAYLDQEASPEQRALVEADPELLALVAAYADVQVAVTAPVTSLPADVTDGMVAAALAAAPGAVEAPAGTSGAATGAGATVVPITAARRAQQTRRALAVAGGLAAAAAVAVVALVISRGDAGDSTAGGAASETTAAAAPAPDRQATEAASAATDAGAESAGGGVARSTTAAPRSAPASEAPAAERPAVTTPPAGDASTLAGLALEDLGPLANRTEVIAAVRRFATVAAAPGTGPCAPYPPPLATATFQGTPAYLVIVETAPAGNRLALVDIGTCAVLVKVDTAEL
jgi:hypothetical protein